MKGLLLVAFLKNLHACVCGIPSGMYSKETARKRCKEVNSVEIKDTKIAFSEWMDANI